MNPFMPNNTQVPSGPTDFITPEEKIKTVVNVADNFFQAALGEKRLDKAVYSTIDCVTDTVCTAADRALDVALAPLNWVGSWFR